MFYLCSFLYYKALDVKKASFYGAWKIYFWRKKRRSVLERLGVRLFIPSVSAIYRERIDGARVDRKGHFCILACDLVTDL